MSANGPYTFGFIDSLVRINFPQGGDNFLCSVDALDGLHLGRSRDGVTWTANPTPGTGSLFGAAYGNNTWVVSFAAFISRSTDGGLTWSDSFDPGISTFQRSDVAYIRPDSSKPGIFLCVMDRNLGVVSTDLGVSWSTAFDGGGNELPQFGNRFISGLSAGGNKFFITTSGDSASDGMGGFTGDTHCYIYSSTDGVSWSGPIQLFSGMPVVILNGIPRNMSASFVAYDSKSKSYAAIGSIPSIINTSNPGIRFVLGIDTSSNGNSWTGGTAFGSAAQSVAGAEARISGGNGFVVSAVAFAPNPVDSFFLFPSYYVAVTSPGGNIWNINTLPNGGDTSGTVIAALGSCGVAYSKTIVISDVRGVFAYGADVPIDNLRSVIRIWTSHDGNSWTEQTQDFVSQGANLPLQFMVAGKLKAIP